MEPKYEIVLTTLFVWGGSLLLFLLYRLWPHLISAFLIIYSVFLKGAGAGLVFLAVVGIMLSELSFAGNKTQINPDFYWVIGASLLTFLLAALESYLVFRINRRSEKHNRLWDVR